MTVLRSVRVDCDGCYCTGDEASTLHEVRTKLRKDGWYMRGRVDLCPACRAKRGKKKLAQ
jgi:hypothetical protein